MSDVEQLTVGGYDAVWRIDCGGAIAFVALHAVLAGHAFGGIRIRSYPDEDAALADVLALARGMSRKVVLAGIDGGGGKSVLMEPGPGVDRAECVRRLGLFIESLAGTYCCGPDLGFTDADDVALRAGTRHVACAGLGHATSRSVKLAMEAVAGRPDVVAIQGLGAVGRPLAEALVADGVSVLAADVRPLDDLPAGVELLPPDRILAAECDVLAPCAAGGVLDATTIPQVQARIICGGANNPCADDAAVEALHARGILYVPDVLANAGATIVGASRTLGEQDRIEERMAALGPRVAALAAEAREAGRPLHELAMARADERIASLRLL